MFHVHRSNRTELLVASLGELVTEPLSDALRTECVVVQSQGMARWLSLALSARVGVWANAAFPFPRAFIEGLVETVTGNREPSATREALGVAIAEELCDVPEDRRYAPVRRYISDDPRGVKRYELANRIAHLFDQYAVYRPEMVLSWDGGGGDDDWQADLWRRCMSRVGARHVAERLADFARALPGASLGLLPERVSVFGVSALPPLYLEMFRLLSRRMEVHLFQLSPCREYWGTLRGRRSIVASQKSRAERQLLLPFAEPKPEAESEPDAGLLGSLGRQGQQFFELLEERTEYVEHEAYVEPDPGTLLGALQADLLALRVRNGESTPRLSLPTVDDSIEFASCHSVTRELAALQERLLGWFQADPTLEPQHVLVMLPDIDGCAPHIDAVFGLEATDPRHIPFRVADRTEKRKSSVVEAVLTLLSLPGTRVTCSQVLDLLQIPPVAGRFEITAEEQPDALRLLLRAGVRWGIDERHRAEHGQPEDRTHTFRFGLDRLLLGVAMAPKEATLFAGVLPYDDVEGDNAALAGKLAHFAETLFGAIRSLSASRPLEEFCAVTLQLLNSLLREDDDTLSEFQLVRRSLEQLDEVATRVGQTTPITVEVFRDMLGQGLGAERREHEFLTGGVTFSAALPMRSIPFRVVCLLGLEDGAFPRTDRGLSFDRMADSPRPGDRSLRDEDRYLFLEALLSARERLYLSWVGRGIQDNSERPASVVVEELLDALDAGYRFVDPEGNGSLLPSEVLRVEHPLSPFDARYFDGSEPRLFSHSREHERGAQARQGALIARRPAFSGSLPKADVASSLTLDQLCRFFRDPVRDLCEKRLGIRLTSDVLRVEDREPVELDALAKYHLGFFVVQRLLAGDSLERIRELLRARGELPLGQPGERELAVLAQTAERIARATAELQVGSLRPPRRTELQLGDTLLSFELRDEYVGKQVLWDYGQLRGKRQIDVWLRHLGSCAASDAPLPTVAVMRAKTEATVLRFEPIARDKAQAHLRDLIGWFHEGQLAPLRFAPSMSLAYAETFLAKPGDPDAHTQALHKARKGQKSDFAGATWDEPYEEFAFGNVGLVDGDPEHFGEIACAVFEPLLAARTRAEEGDDE